MEHMEVIKKYIGSIEYDANFYGVVVALVVVLLTIVLFLFIRRKSVSRRNVLITGLSDSGKTLLFLDLYHQKMLGIIFVVDSLNFQKEIRDVAGFLFMLLQEPIVHMNRVPFLIACNKQDHAVSKGAKVIQSQLEKEISTLRITQTGRLESISGSGNRIFVGQKGKDFQFSDLKSNKVEFLECSAQDSEDEVGDLVKAWLLKIA
ncbi:signal recognition particle receptor subunit beta [Caerostris extrusa]|uniref:Signal recognition particle receptor subunit beta n=1 Tax=Caerostris extrusa TaxID=172846 RepID=A0AAV4UQ21_CAEEX|nr:signal recognition particle receptor subunit beta [Caerostris extrusa]